MQSEGNEYKEKKKEKELMLICYGLDFWGPVSNFGIPVAAVMDTQKDPEMYVCYYFSFLDEESHKN